MMWNVKNKNPTKKILMKQFNLTKKENINGKRNKGKIIIRVATIGGGQQNLKHQYFLLYIPPSLNYHSPVFRSHIIH